MFYDKTSKTLGFIVYSNYGLQSHIVMNKHGVVFSLNPMICGNGSCAIWPTEAAAKSNMDEFYDRIAEVVMIAKYEKG